MRVVHVLLAVLLLLTGCAAERLPTTDTVPARAVVERADRHGQPAPTSLQPPQLPTAQLVAGHPDFVDQGEAALALIDLPWQELGWPVHLLPRSLAISG